MTTTDVEQTTNDDDLENEFSDVTDNDEVIEIVWEQPPTLRRGRKQVDGANFAIANTLKNKEGEWAKIAENSRDSSLVSKIKKANHKAYEPAGSFEATSRRDKDGNITVWARFVGEPDEIEEDDLEDDDLDPETVDF